MAIDKKSFVIYTDIIHTFEALEDDEAGRLIKHLLRYVNDLNPSAPDKITQIAFEPIKQQLKRDLVKWNGVKEVKSFAGHIGGLKSGEVRRKQKEANEADALKLKQNEANEAVNVSVNDNVSVSVSVINNNFSEKIILDQLIYENAYRIHKCTQDAFVKIVNSFFTIQKANGKEWSDYRDCAKHFNNWLPKFILPSDIVTSNIIRTKKQLQ